MDEQSAEGAVTIENPNSWSDEKLTGEIDKVALQISKISDTGKTQEAAKCVTLSAKLNLYSNVLAGRASEAARKAADQESASNRELSEKTVRLTKETVRLTKVSIYLSVISTIFAFLSYCKPSTPPQPPEVRHDGVNVPGVR